MYAMLKKKMDFVNMLNESEYLSYVSKIICLSLTVSDSFEEKQNSHPFAQFHHQVDLTDINLRQMQFSFIKKGILLKVDKSI